MDRLLKERDTLARHLTLSQSALEEFKDMHDASLAQLQSQTEALEADASHLRSVVQAREEELARVSHAFERLLELREASLEDQRGQDDVRTERILHARGLAIGLAGQLESAQEELDKVKEQRDAALTLLEAKESELHQGQVGRVTQLVRCFLSSLLHLRPGNGRGL